MAGASLLPAPSIERPEVPHPVPHQLAGTTWDQPGSRGRSAAATACRRGPVGTREDAVGPQAPDLKPGRARASWVQIPPPPLTWSRCRPAQLGSAPLTAALVAGQADPVQPETRYAKSGEVNIAYQ